MSSLRHYGILGMKWGVRRYQNPDGSLTSEGRSHYGVSGIRSSEKELFDEKTGRARGLTKDLTIKSGTELNKVVRRTKGDSGRYTYDREYFSLTPSDNEKWTNYFRNEPGVKTRLEQVATTTIKDVKLASATKVGEEYIKAMTAIKKKHQKSVDVYKKTGKRDKTYSSDDEWAYADAQSIESFVNQFDSRSLNSTYGFRSIPTRNSDRDTTNAFGGSYVISRSAGTDIYNMMRDSLKKQGYNGAFDFLGTDVAETPIILFDAETATGSRAVVDAGKSGRSFIDRLLGS